MIPTIYRYKKGQEDVPDDTPNEELEAKRHKADNIGAILGTATGAGLGYWVKGRGHDPVSVIPKLIAATTAGYVMGRSGAYAYNSMFNTRENELRENQTKEASLTTDIDSLSIPDSKKALLAISRAHAKRSKQGIVFGEAVKKQRELAGKSINKGAARVRVPIIMTPHRNKEKQ